MNKEDFIKEVLQYIEKNRVFDLISISLDGTEMVISNLGKIQKNENSILFYEKDCFGFWQKVPFLKAPFTILNNSGTPLSDSAEITNPSFVESWVSDCVFEIVRHVVQQFFSYGAAGSVAYEFFLIKEIVREILDKKLFNDQQLLCESKSKRAFNVTSFHRAIKLFLMDDDFAKCVSQIRDNVTLFEFTFSLRNKSSLIQHGQNWVNLLPSLAKTQTECLLLSKNGKYSVECADWVEVLEDDVDWSVNVNPKLQEYIKHIPVTSLRALIGRNISHSLAIMQLAKIKPNAPVGLFSYISKVLDKKDISSDNYEMYAQCLSKVINYASCKLGNEYNSILDVCYSSQMFEHLLAHYKDNGITSKSVIEVYKAVSTSISESIKTDFEKMVCSGDLDIYVVQGGSKTDYFTVMKCAKNITEFALYEKCQFLVGDTGSHRSESDDLEWWYAHVADYRILISKISGSNEICNIYSMDNALSCVEIEAIQKIMSKITKQNNKKTS